MAQLSMEEREVISQLFAAGHSRKAIAERLGRARSTIGRELKRNIQEDGSYLATVAQRKTRTRCQQRTLTRKMDRPELHAEVRSSLTKEWSPDQIAGRLKRAHPDDPRFCVSPQTIYTWIEQDQHAEHWKTRELCSTSEFKPPYKRSSPVARHLRQPEDRPRVGSLEVRSGVGLLQHGGPGYARMEPE